MQPSPRRPPRAARPGIGEGDVQVRSLAWSGSFPVVVLDCPDPKSLAEFYGALLDWRVEQNDDHSWSVRAEYGDSLGFQKVDGFTPPQWPGQGVPQQMHLDVVVDDLDVAEAAVHE